MVCVKVLYVPLLPARPGAGAELGAGSLDSTNDALAAPVLSSRRAAAAPKRRSMEVDPPSGRPPTQVLQRRRPEDFFWFRSSFQPTDARCPVPIKDWLTDMSVQIVVLVEFAHSRDEQINVGEPLMTWQ